MRWKRLGRDLLVIQLGFLMFGFAIALLIRSNLGTGAWVVLEVALSQLTGLTPGTLTVLVGLVVLVVALALREKIGWGTLANILCIGPWEDLGLRLIPSVDHNLPVQIPLFLLGTGMMGLATALYISVEAGAGPRDSLMLAIHRVSGWSVRLTRAVIEVTVVSVGWLLGGPAGLGTVAFALLIGPTVQWGFKLFNVHPHREQEPEPLQAPAD